MRELLDLVPDSLKRFVIHWHGTPQEVPPVDSDADDALPGALRTWYALAAVSAWMSEGPFGVLAAADVEESQGRTVFLREDQEVYEWAFDASDLGSPDPWVYERAVAEGEPWHPSEVRLSAFLVTVAVFTAVFTADHQISSGELTRTKLDRLLQPLSPLPVPGPTVHAQLYAGAEADILAFTIPDVPGDQTPNDDSRWSIYLAARDLEHLRYAERILSDPADRPVATDAS